MLIRLLTLSAVATMLAAPVYADPADTAPLPAIQEGLGSITNFLGQAKSFADDNTAKMKQIKDMAKTLKAKKTDQTAINPPDQPAASDSTQP